MSETNLFYSEESDGMSKRAQLEEYFSQSLEVDLLLRLCPDDEDTIYQIVDLLVDTCATNRKLLHIAGDDKPAEVVRSRFMKLNADHIKFVLKCLAENSSPIRNICSPKSAAARCVSCWAALQRWAQAPMSRPCWWLCIIWM